MRVPSIVVALGGNALLPPGESDLAAMHRRLQESARALADLAGHARLAVTHGNGPQVGHLMAATEAMLKRARGWHLAADPRGGWRRVVPSPRPREIVELPAIRALLDADHVVITAGGGGFPVVRNGDALVGIEAVIDKDLASAVLARALAADRLILARDVDRVALDFQKPSQRLLERLTAREARQHLKEGQFSPGSMGPKVEAAVEFVEGGGKEAVITSLVKLRDALDGATGTRITG